MCMSHRQAQEYPAFAMFLRQLHIQQDRLEVVENVFNQVGNPKLSSIFSWTVGKAHKLNSTVELSRSWQENQCNIVHNILPLFSDCIIALMYLDVVTANHEILLGG